MGKKQSKQKNDDLLATNAKNLRQLDAMNVKLYQDPGYPPQDLVSESNYFLEDEKKKRYN